LVKQKQSSLGLVSQIFNVDMQMKAFRILALIILLCGFSPIGLKAETEAQHSSNESGQEAFDPGRMIIEHILDSYEWHILSKGNYHLSIPLPVILIHNQGIDVFLSSRFHHGHNAYKGYVISEEGAKKGKIVWEDKEKKDFLLDLSITKNVLSVFFSCILLCLVFVSIGKNYKKNGYLKAPQGLQSYMEPLVLFVRDEIAVLGLGKENYHRFLPYLLTLFFFIFFNNIMGLIPFFPGGANVTGNISVTMVLAFFSFFITQFSSNKTYWKHIFNTPGVPWWLKIPFPLMPIIELVGVLTKPVVLMIRLFANITAGHMIILGFTALIFILGNNVGLLFGYAISPLSLVFMILMNFIELLVAFIQAYVFTLFSAVFFGMAIPDEHHH